MNRIFAATAFLFSLNFISAQEKPKSEPKEKQIEGVTIVSTKKAVEQKADRTIFDFSEQPHLNSGSLMEGVKKLPGLIVSDVAGMLYQGKMLQVYMDGRPLNISTNELNAFLEGMPANSVERIEIITQPGAEFPATSGGAILNIITSKTARNYLTATYSGNYNFTSYDKFRHRVNNSMSLNSRNKYFGWQLNFGQNYRESMMNGDQDGLVLSNTDRIMRGYFAKSALTFELGVDRLLLNYDFYHKATGELLFKGYPYADMPIAGKTGTAQGFGNFPWNDSSAFGAFSLDPAQPYSAFAYLEKSGYGSQASAPVVKCMFMGISGNYRFDELIPADPLNLASTLVAPPTGLRNPLCLAGGRSDNRD